MNGFLEKDLKRIQYMSPMEQMRLFEEIYQAYHKLIYYILSKYIEDVEDIGELVNDVFLNFYNNILNVNSSVKYYLVTSAKHIGLDYVKKKKDILLDHSLMSVQQESYSNSCGKVKRILQEILTEEEIYIIEEHLFFERKFKDIAREKSSSLSKVKSIYYRALRKVRKYYEQR